MKLHLALIAIVFAMSFSCSTTRIQFDIEKPAEITLPSHIRSFGIMERSRGGSYDVKEQAILGLSSMLNQNDRFVIKDTGLRSNRGFTFSRDYSRPLDWVDVDDICSRDNLDGLISLEYFDADIRLREKENQRKTKSKSGADSTYVEYVAEQTGDLEIGWRIYDRTKKVVIDKYELREQVRDKEKGATAREARLALRNERDLLKDICLDMGRVYARRVSPYRVNASRKLFKKGKSNQGTMEQAMRQIDRGEYGRARNLWRKIIDKGADQKTLGRAAYNIAVTYELDGDFGKAHDWAIKSLDNYGNKSAKSYLRTLDDRVRDEKVVDRQYE